MKKSRYVAIARLITISSGIMTGEAFLGGAAIAAGSVKSTPWKAIVILGIIVLGAILLAYLNR